MHGRLLSGNPDQSSLAGQMAESEAFAAESEPRGRLRDARTANLVFFLALHIIAAYCRLNKRERSAPPSSHESNNNMNDTFRPHTETIARIFRILNLCAGGSQPRQ
jgi:hypothetical protein